MSKKISVARLTSQARHTVIVPLTLEDEAGNVEKVDARVVYRGISLKEGAALDEQLEKLPDNRAKLVFILTSNVISLPDFVGDGGDPVEPTHEFFDALDTVVLNRIHDAITEDRNPNARP